MKKNLTEMVFILDKSGSMSGLEGDTIGGFNGLIRKQKDVDGEAFVSTILFDQVSSIVHDRVDLKEIAPMTEKDYCVSGCTAMLDAIGGAIRHIENIHKYAREEDVPEHTIFVITTDGMENASRSFSYDDVRKLIEKKQQDCGWEFVFLGANIDAAATAGRMGISQDNCAEFLNDSMGIETNYRALNDKLLSSRLEDCMPRMAGSWKKSIEEDRKRRGKK